MKIRWIIVSIQLTIGLVALSQAIGGVEWIPKLLLCSIVLILLGVLVVVLVIQERPSHSRFYFGSALWFIGWGLLMIWLWIRSNYQGAWSVLRFNFYPLVLLKVVLPLL